MPILTHITPPHTGGVAVKIWSDEIEEKALGQLKNIARLPFIHKHIAAMPDVHFGMGATVGSVIACKRAVIPAAVGVDIGCVDAETECLTLRGWVRMDEWDGQDICQYDPLTDIAEFVEPLEYINLPCDSFLEFKSKYGVNQRLSDEHRMLLYRAGRKREFTKDFVMRADEFAAEHSERVQGLGHGIKTAFSISRPGQLSWSDQELRVLVAVSADGHMRNERTRNCVIGLKKHRKQVRLRQILQLAEIPYNETQHGDKAVFSFKSPGPKGLEHLWNADRSQLGIIGHECLHWDGSKKDQVFYTSRKDEADFIHYAFSATGSRSVMRCDPARVEGHAEEYRVFRYEGTITTLKATPHNRIERVSSEDGRKYCFRVPSSFFVIRRGGNVAITGNCGMKAVLTNLTASDLPDSLKILRTAIERSVPVGFNSHVDMPRGKRGEPLADLARIHAGWEPIIQKHPKIQWKGPSGLNAQLGTLGGGNHFIEVCLDKQDRVWVMLHSGSRNIGNVVARYFIDRAKELMERYHIELPDRDLAFFPEGEQEFDDYCEAVEWAQDYALSNRESMMQIVLQEMLHYFPSMQVLDGGTNCHHNYIARESHFGQNVIVTRKGAVRARAGDLGIIPGSMGAKSFIVRGLGNADSFHSCSHGAGRQMSRTEARRRFSADDLAAQTFGVECRKDEGVVDEIPGAYKDIDVVMANQSDLVEIVAELRQVLCVKG